MADVIAVRESGLPTCRRWKMCGSQCSRGRQTSRVPRPSGFLPSLGSRVRIPSRPLVAARNAVLRGSTAEHDSCEATWDRGGCRRLRTRGTSGHRASCVGLRLLRFWGSILNRSWSQTTRSASWPGSSAPSACLPRTTRRHRGSGSLNQPWMRWFAPRAWPLVLVRVISDAAKASAGRGSRCTLIPARL